MDHSNEKKPRQEKDDLSVPLLDVTRGGGQLRDEILSEIADVYDSGKFINGPPCQQLQEGVARFCGSEYAIGCASGSDAILLALMACDIGPGDEVVVPSFTFFSTASAVWRLGATPVFADIEHPSFNLDAASVADVITPATKAIIPVHLFGQCADMRAICRIAQQHSIRVIEDAAQAMGASYQGRRAGSLGDLGCFSFYPTKNLGGLGDGGMITTSDPELAARTGLLASHGMNPRYYHRVVGINSRLDSIQAAALNVKLRHLNQWTARRQHNAARYHQLFEAAQLADVIELPQVSPDCEHVWNQYTIRIPDGQRDVLRQRLTTAKVGTEVYYPVALHRQECFSDKFDIRTHLWESELAAKEVLSLPIFPELSQLEQQFVVEQIAEFFVKSDVRQTTSPRRLAS